MYMWGWELRLVCVHVGLGVEGGLCTCWGWELRVVCVHVGVGRQICI